MLSSLITNLNNVVKILISIISFKIITNIILGRPWIVVYKSVREFYNNLTIILKKKKKDKNISPMFYALGIIIITTFSCCET